VTAIETRSEQRSFGGTQGFHQHDSLACAGPMRFAMYLPPQQLAGESCPVLYYLPGLTCNEETFVIKAGAQKLAAELGLVLVSVDSSPRAARYPGDDAAWDFGQGAGFYLDATQSPWSQSYRMETWVTDELPTLLERELGLSSIRGIFGHSMGGHGALTLALRHPERYRSVSALAPIVAPSQVPWGHKAFTGYLGEDPDAWLQHDAVALLRAGHRFPSVPRVDQGLADKFLEEQLRPELLEQACKAADQNVVLRRHEGYDHSYYFVASFIDAHLQHHWNALRG
jgi:S-formylglutathione hydrolase